MIISIVIILMLVISGCSTNSKILTREDFLNYSRKKIEENKNVEKYDNKEIFIFYGFALVF